MCGIVGIVQPENRGAIEPDILRRMNSSIKHRGPDDEGYWIHHHVGIAMRRLSIIDVDGGHQPLSNETGDIWTVFNGEIYNFQELREELIQKGHRFQCRTDTEIIPHLYEEEGDQFVHRLRGMFAIALWDNRQKKLLLYRDRVGIKPLHYWFRKGTLIFGSEIKALLEYPEVGTDISFSAVSDYLSYLYIPSPKTIYREIMRLPPGHFLRWQNQEIQVEQYWDFNFKTQDGLKEQEWAEKLRETVSESVKCHLISDVPLGAFLSGGMDSSTVVAWMSRHSSQSVKTFSIGFKNAEFNELSYAREVANYFKTDHHEEIVEPDAVTLLPKILSSLDEPFADSSAIPTYLVSEFTRHKVTVALSGDGGDELFGGYLWTQKEIILEKYRRLPAFLRRSIRSLVLGKDYNPLHEIALWNKIKRSIFDAESTPAESFARRSMCFQSWMKRELFQKSFQNALGKESSVDLIKSYFNQCQATTLLDKLLYLDSKIYLPGDILTKVDRMSMIHSLEVRVPILDHKVVELAASIPFSFKMRGSATKYILKQAMKNILPPSILTQRKRGFAIPLQLWFRGELFSLARRVLVETKVLSYRYFNPQYVKWVLEQHRSGRQSLGNHIYALLIFELWLRLAEETKGKVARASVTLKDLVG